MDRLHIWTSALHLCYIWVTWILEHVSLLPLRIERARDKVSFKNKSCYQGAECQQTCVVASKKRYSNSVFGILFSNAHDFFSHAPNLIVYILYNHIALLIPSYQRFYGNDVITTRIRDWKNEKGNTERKKMCTYCGCVGINRKKSLFFRYMRTEALSVSFINRRRTDGYNLSQPNLKKGKIS